MHPDAEKQYRHALEVALIEGGKVLDGGGSALHAVETAVRLLEDSPLFNAGRGSVFNGNGQHEMDAAIMCGRTLAAGAVAAVSGVRNPVELARKVLEDERYVLLCGRGAEAYARELQIAFEPDAYFFTEERHAQLLAARENRKMILDHDGESQKFGTVGAVALDRAGNVAAATSTGGLTNKQYGRIGDTPLIGSGTYANNRTCAVSCTGYGEAFIRSCVAHEVSSRMQYLGEDLRTATRKVVHEGLPQLNGEGGLIAVDTRGHLSLPFNTDGMYRGWIGADGSLQVEIYGAG